MVLPVPGGPVHEQVVAAGGRDRKRPLGMTLAAHVVQREPRLRLRRTARQQFRRRWQCIGLEQLHHLAEVAHGMQLDVAERRQLRKMLRRRHQSPRCGGNRGGRREGAAHGTQVAVEGELAQEFQAVQVLCRHLPRGHQNGDGDGKVIPAALLGKIGRGEVDGDASVAPVETDAANGGAHPVARFPNGGFRHPHDGKRRAAGLVICLHENPWRIHAHLGTRVDWVGHGLAPALARFRRSVGIRGLGVCRPSPAIRVRKRRFVPSFGAEQAPIWCPKGPF